MNGNGTVVAVSECNHNWDEQNTKNTYCTKCGLTYYAYEEILDLRAKLEMAEIDFGKLQFDFESRSLWAETFKSACERVEKERDELSKKTEQLESQVDLLRGALKDAMNHLVRNAKNSDTGYLYQICRRATDATPAEAKKVQELEKYAELGRLVEKGLTEIQENIKCKSMYGSDYCKEIGFNTLGCVLKYFCAKRAELKQEENNNEL